jgi:hypothetical protein
VILKLFVTVNCVYTMAACVQLPCTHAQACGKSTTKFSTTRERLGKEARIWKSRGIPSQSNDFTATVPVTKSYENHIEKNQLLCVYPLPVWDRIRIHLRIRGRLVKEFFKNIKTWRSYRGENIYALWIVTTIVHVVCVQVPGSIRIYIYSCVHACVHGCRSTVLE